MQLSQYDDDIRAAMVAEGNIIDHAESMRNPDLESLSEKFEELQSFAEELNISVSAWALCQRCSTKTEITHDLSTFIEDHHFCGDCQK